MISKTRTATLTDLDESGLKLSAMFVAASALAKNYNDFENVVITNTGDADIEVASMEGGIVPATADYKTVPSGAELRFDRISSKDFYVRATDDAADNSLEFIGTPC